MQLSQALSEVNIKNIARASKMPSNLPGHPNAIETEQINAIQFNDRSLVAILTSNMRRVVLDLDTSDTAVSTESLK